VLLEHNADDPLVLVENGRGLRDTLRRFGAQVEWKEYPTGMHWFKEDEGMDDVVEFLTQVVNGVRDVVVVRPGGQSQTVVDGDAMDLS
jgi:predicted esterase